MPALDIHRRAIAKLGDSQANKTSYLLRCDMNRLTRVWPIMLLAGHLVVGTASLLADAKKDFEMLFGAEARKVANPGTPYVFSISGRGVCVGGWIVLS